jgi:MobA-like NTP transferase domain
MTRSTAATLSEDWTLAVLAAGRGRRYHGDKQLETVGPAGETLSDYGLWDARQAGARNAVFVTRPDLVDTLRAHHSRWGSALSVEHVVQRIEDLPAGFTPPPERTRPWGTVHAVLTARSHIRGPFAVVNADDFYGRDPIRRAGEFLAGTPPHARELAVVGYRLRDTLSAHGGVSRALLETGDDLRIRRIIELSDITPSTRGLAGRRNDESIRLTGDELVSMNLWALTPAVFEPLEEVFAGFLRDHGESVTAECALPETMDKLLVAKRISVRVLLPTANSRQPTATSSWLGLTHPGDRDATRAAIRERVARDEYPADLFQAARG